MERRVDRNTLRTNQAFIVGLTVLAFILGDAVGRWVVLFTGLVMALGTIHATFALFKQVHQRVLKPAGLLGPDVHAEDPMPHQFAQALGAVFLLAAFVALAGGAILLGWVLTWIVTALAFVNLAVQFCAGCFMYYQLDRFGLLPRAIASSRGASPRGAR
jgi:Na+/melibiose symporter-like transporter